jgi:DNA replication and repair protein RecF
LIIRKLKLTGFRNLDDGTLEFAERGHLIVGDNGQGKTNLLEAIHYLTVLRSFRGCPDRECVRFDGEHFQLTADWQDDQGEREAISLGFDGAHKKVTLSGKEKRFVSEAFGRFKSVILTPEDIGIVQQGPSARRKYLDIVLSIISPIYLERLKRYRKALASRNVLLRRTPFSENQIRPWEKQMAESGSYLIREREMFISQLSPYVTDLIGRLSPGEKGSLRYSSSILGDSEPGEVRHLELEKIRETFEYRLNRNRPVERERGISLTGPQTDEMAFEIDGRPLRNFGSQGQQRTSVICLKMAEAELMEKNFGLRAVLLLDDIFAELDLHRSLRLLEELVHRHQSFITAPRKEAVFERLGHLPVKYIHQGRVVDG